MFGDFVPAEMMDDSEEEKSGNPQDDLHHPSCENSHENGSGDESDPNDDGDDDDDDEEEEDHDDEEEGDEEDDDNNEASSLMQRPLQVTSGGAGALTSTLSTTGSSNNNNNSHTLRSTRSPQVLSSFRSRKHAASSATTTGITTSTTSGAAASVATQRKRKKAGSLLGGTSTTNQTTSPARKATSGSSSMNPVASTVTTGGSQVAVETTGSTVTSAVAAASPLPSTTDSVTEAVNSLLGSPSAFAVVDSSPTPTTSNVAVSKHTDDVVRGTSRTMLSQNADEEELVMMAIAGPSSAGHASSSATASASAAAAAAGGIRRTCRSWCPATFRICNLMWVNSRKSTLKCMNILAKIVLWCTFVALAAAVVWYSYELFNHGTDPHLIAWFSAGAFVILGFPISMWGIITHLANYNQPRVQQYIIRILWMVPIYSIESWLAMRFHKQAIYIETARDFYESYVLYSFLQFLIEVLGGEEALILMLKDKSPTRGFHMWGLQWCVKPWLMGQPVRKLTVYRASANNDHGGSAVVKRVHWTSPFFVKCKFGVLQYVLLKFLCAAAVLLLEWRGWYKEGKFTWDSGYLYICFLTNVSQCWALYCLIFFYYATHTELSPIRPVGKFLSVKALVFFTWWQSVVIAILYQMNMIPQYVSETVTFTQADVAKGIQDYLICIEMFVAAIIHTFVFPHSEYSPRAVEARMRALNHTVPMKNRRRLLGRLANNNKYSIWRDDVSKSSGNAGVEMTSLDDSLNGELDTSLQRLRSNSFDSEPLLRPGHGALGDDDLGGGWRSDDEVGNLRFLSTVEDTDDEDDHTETTHPVESPLLELSKNQQHHHYLEVAGGDEVASYASSPSRSGGGDAGSNDSRYGRAGTGFVRAFIDSTIPRDLRDNAVGIVTGEYSVEKKTLLHHAATSDQYDLFSPNRRPFRRKNEP